MTSTSSAQARPEAPTATILLVDDEPALLAAVGYTLRREGYLVSVAATGPDALTSARAMVPDLIVLDVMLPGLDGLQVVRALRAESTVPILLLSAKGEEVDRVVGLELGADDYLTKPFAMRELLARIRAMLRRARMANGHGSAENGAAARASMAPVLPPAPAEPRAFFPPVVDTGDLSIDPGRRRVTLGGQPLTLKPKEFDLLLYLASHPGLVVSREVLLRRVWGYDHPIDTRTVDVHVRWLRQKIETDPSQPRRIETVRGSGYRFVPDHEAEPV